MLKGRRRPEEEEHNKVPTPDKKYHHEHEMKYNLYKKDHPDKNPAASGEFDKKFYL